MARILKDKKFDTTFDNEQFYSDTLKQHSTTLVEYANQWTLDLNDPEEVHRKIAELQWMNSVVYAVSGFEGQDKKFFADFFLYVYSSVAWASTDLYQDAPRHFVTVPPFLCGVPHSAIPEDSSSSLFHREPRVVGLSSSTIFQVGYHKVHGGRHC